MGWTRAVTDLLAPPRCPACGRRSPPPWCTACDRGVQRAATPDAGCGRCGLGGADPGDGHPCWAAAAPVARSLVPYAYAGPVADAVVAGKAAGLTAVWPALGARLAGYLASARPAVDVVVPVPTDPRRHRARGVDHTAALARAVASGLDLPAAPLLTVAPGLPDRGRRARGDRWALPPDAFRARAAVRGARVLLVDDVVTTGTTAAAAATAALVGGGRVVVLGVVARAGLHRLGATSATART